MGIVGGKRWRSRLYERLRWADAVVCVVSSASVASTWCTAEVSSALLWGSRLVPIVVEPGVVHPLLSDVQHIDQFEEVLTQATAAARARFARLLHPALGGPVQVVATLRPEFLDPLLSDPDLAAIPTRLYPLRPLRRDELRAVIENPARLAGLGVDDELVARLVADTDSGEALPLLAFTLAQLAEGLTRGAQLSQRRYDYNDHTARLWETTIDRVTDRLCGSTPTLTKSQWDDYLPGLTYRPPCK